MVVCFNLLTFAVFITAPYKWETSNLTLVAFFVFFCQLCILAGYKFGYKKGDEAGSRSKSRELLLSIRPKLIFAIYFITFIIKYAYLLNHNPSDILGLIQIIVDGIKNPQIGYSLAVDPLRYTSIPWTVYFFISIPNQMFFLAGFTVWQRLGFALRAIFVGFIVLEGLFWMSRGANFGIVSMVTTFLLCRLVVQRSGANARSKSVVFVLSAIILLVCSVAIFSYNLTARGGYAEIDYQNFNLGDSKVNRQSIVFSILPDALHSTYMFVVSYFAQGYYHLCLAFDIDFKSTYFLGTNPATVSFAADVFRFDVWPRTYVYRLWSLGVDPLVNWHSAYVWFANDFSFLGVPFLLGAIGWGFGYSAAASRYSHDFLTTVVFVYCGNILLYLFANNSYLSSIFYSVIFVLPVWLSTRVLGFGMRKLRSTSQLFKAPLLHRY